MKEDNMKRYECKCPVCGRIFWACKSIAQEDWNMLEAGHGSCPGCNTFHNLTFDKENQRMVVTPWEEFIKKQEARNA